jgi:hypothetical protein
LSAEIIRFSLAVTRGLSAQRPVRRLYATTGALRRVRVSSQGVARRTTTEARVARFRPISEEL